MAIVGAIARVDRQSNPAVEEELARLPGVSLLATADPEKLGFLVEAESISAAHAVLVDDVGGQAGVLGVWPIYLDTEETGEA